MNKLKKILLIFSLLLFLTQLTQAQTCPFHVQFKTINATCYNNGKVVYALFDNNGILITDTSTLRTEHHITDVRIYYKTDTVHYGNDYRGGWDTLTIDYGEYTIGVEGICSGSPIDTQTVLIVNTNYQTPTAGALGKNATSLDGMGRRPTLTCQNTGRIQLKIEGGRLPFTVIMMDGAENPIDTIVFTEKNSGTNVYRWDYKDYYTIDSLTAGNYIFHIEDACGTGLPNIPQTVDTIGFAKLNNISVFASSGNFEDNNIVKINVELDQNHRPYFANLISEYAQYRFTHSGGLGASEWKSFPETSQKTVLFYDTIAGANKYCDIWDKNISFEYKLTSCGSSTTTKTIQIHKPAKRFYSTADTLTTKYHGIDSIGYKKKFGTDEVRHTHDYKIHYFPDNDDYLNTSRYNSLIKVSQQNADPDQSFHYTHPLVWKYVDTKTGDTIKQETVSTIVDWSYIYCTDIESYYGSFVDSTLVVNIERILVDGNNCVLVDTISDMVFRYWYPGCGYHPQEWICTQDNASKECGEKRSVLLYGRHISNVIKDSMRVCLVKSPLGNYYNFDAIYNASTGQWDISTFFMNKEKIKFENTGISVTLTDEQLPSGIYEFNIQYRYHTCSADTSANITVRKNFKFSNTYSIELAKEPVYELTQDCSVLNLKFLEGQYNIITRRTSSVDSFATVKKTSDLQNARFKIISGPVGGYDEDYFKKGDSTLISIPGTYVISMEPKDYPCTPPPHYDTIVNPGGSVTFKYDMALLCNQNDTVGDVYVEATDGKKPYTYVLYSGKDKTGDVLGTSAVGHFHDIRMRTSQVLSCLVTDACGAYFYVNIYPNTLAKIQKIWFDDHRKDTTICEGSSISVHALDAGDYFSYEWTGPNGFHSTSSDSTLYISRGDTSGWYKVTITGTECNAISDSIYLNIKKSPTLSMALSVTDAVCPCQDVTVSFRPESTDPTADTIYFTIAYVNANGIEERHYKAKAGETVTDSYNSATLARIFPLRIDDGNCDYTLADDTVKLPIREDIISSCNILTTDTIVCFNETAQLYARASDSVQPPYVLRWYEDYGLTNLLQTDSIKTDGVWSEYTTPNITKHTIRYITIEKEGKCTTVYGNVAHTLNMDNDTSITLSCGESWRVYDSGGPDGNYKIDQTNIYHFNSEDGGPVALHFDSRQLASGSELWIFSGNLIAEDSLLYSFNSTQNHNNPGLIVSRGNALTVYFVSKSNSGSGWSAIVERSPGIAIADPWPQNKVEITYRTCRSQKNTWNDLGNPHHIYPDVVNKLSDLNNALRKEGTHIFPEIALIGAHDCDSLVNFTLIVDPPQHHDTTVVITNMHGGSYYWPTSNKTYTTSGQYYQPYTISGGCDSLAILNLIILEIDTSTNVMCDDTTTIMGITVSEPDMSWREDGIPPTHKIGDILCTNGDIISPEEFLLLPKDSLTPKGVIFYLDSTEQRGLAVSLRYAYNGTCMWAENSVMRSIHSVRDIHHDPRAYYSYQALKDMDGMLNTTIILEYSSNVGGIGNEEMTTPAAYYCYYYDHDSIYVDNRIGSSHKKWYLPSMGESRLLFSFRREVNITLNLLHDKISNVEPFLSDNHWTSTEYGSDPNNELVDLVGYHGRITQGGIKKSGNSRARAVIKFGYDE